MKKTDDASSSISLPDLQTPVLAGRLTAPRHFEERPQLCPVPKSGEVRLRIEGCGVCTSSLPAWQGRRWFEYPFEVGQLGHEGWGVIDGVGPGVSSERIGERIVTWSDGAFAPYLCVGQGDVLTVPDSLEDRPLPVEPLGCAINIIRRARVEAGMPVVVVGVGFLGALLVQLLVAAGCEVSVVARRSFARRLARELGARAAVAFESPEQVREELAELGQSEFPRVIEAVGLAESLDVASPLVTTGGALIVAGYHQDGLRSVNLQEWNWKGIDVINAHERDPDVILGGMKGALAALERGDLNLGPLLTHRYTPGQLDEAFADIETRPDGFLKGWIDFTLQSK